MYGLGNLLISLFSNYVLTHCFIQLQRLILLGVRNTLNILLYLTYCLAPSGNYHNGYFTIGCKC